jgi:hypothetical protein
MDKHIIVISNMTRTEGDRSNEQAGIDVFQTINRAKLKCKCIAFVGDVLSAKNKVK